MISQGLSQDNMKVDKITERCKEDASEEEPTVKEDDIKMHTQNSKEKEGEGDVGASGADAKASTGSKAQVVQNENNVNIIDETPKKLSTAPVFKTGTGAPVMTGTMIGNGWKPERPLQKGKYMDEQDDGSKIIKMWDPPTDADWRF